MTAFELAKKYLDTIPEELRGSPNDLVQLLAAMIAKVEELEDQHERLIFHCVELGKDVRDYGDNADRSTESFVALPDVLQQEINEAQDDG